MGSLNRKQASHLLEVWRAIGEAQHERRLEERWDAITPVWADGRKQREEVDDGPRTR